MNLETALSIYGGGPGSGCNPAAGRCGRTKFSKEELQQFVREWRYPKGSVGFGNPTDETRAKARKILQQTLPGGSLERFHPGKVTVYRGYDKYPVSRKGVSSYSGDKSYAKGYGKKVRSLKLTKNTPALSLQKMGYLGNEILVME